MKGTLNVVGLGKAYKKYSSKWKRLVEWIIPDKYTMHSLHWVLKELDFSVQPGRALGIIGDNGAGKSTLLKLIVGTIQPTEGSINVNGSMAAILELGMGFLPDFTGRQNVYMAGQLLGIPTKKITKLMPEIELFSEIDGYMDEPLRIYSSGMQMRLAFSVATAVRPDILIIDEALSVGDSHFQHKSFNKIRSFLDEGTTLLLVSHDKQAIQALCDHAIYLEGGKIAMQGTPEDVMNYYNAVRSQTPIENTNITTSDGKIVSKLDASGTGEAKISNIQILDEDFMPIEIIRVGQKVVLEINVDVFSEIKRLIVGYGIKDRLGQVIYGTNTHLKNMPITNLSAGDVYTFRFYFDANLGVGVYSIQTSLASTEDYWTNNYEWRDLAHFFTVINAGTTDFAGCAWINPTIEILPR